MPMPTEMQTPTVAEVEAFRRLALEAIQAERHRVACDFSESNRGSVMEARLNTFYEAYKVVEKLAAPATPAGPSTSGAGDRAGGPIDVRSIYVEYHMGIDILRSLYDAAEALPICPLLGVVTGAIQEIQATRPAPALDAPHPDPQNASAGGGAADRAARCIVHLQARCDHWLNEAQRLALVVRALGGDPDAKADPAPASDAPAPAGEDDGEDSYQLGKRDGFEEAIQRTAEALDLDAEYRWSTEPYRHQPGPGDMLANIVEHVEGLRGELARLRPADPSAPSVGREAVLAELRARAEARRAEARHLYDVGSYTSSDNHNDQADALDEAVSLVLTLSATSPGDEPGETAAARDVLAERRRQVAKEGWTPAHDDLHDSGELAMAAGCYALYATGAGVMTDPNGLPADWPFDASWWKPRTPREGLVRAGALILAEIERLDRITPPAGATDAGGASSHRPADPSPSGALNAEC